MATYQSATQLTAEQLQNILDAHPTSSADGKCETCLVLGPCAERYAALAVFASRAQLPTRTAGATHPERVGARRVRL